MWDFCISMDKISSDGFFESLKTKLKLLFKTHNNLMIHHIHILNLKLNNFIEFIFFLPFGLSIIRWVTSSSSISKVPPGNNSLSQLTSPPNDLIQNASGARGHSRDIKALTPEKIFRLSRSDFSAEIAFCNCSSPVSAANKSMSSSVSSAVLLKIEIHFIETVNKDFV